MLRDRLSRHVELFTQFAQCESAAFVQSIDQSSPVGVCKGFEYSVDLSHGVSLLCNRQSIGCLLQI